MALNSLFSRFKPKENKFFPLIADVSEQLQEASALLESLVKTEDKIARKELYAGIKTCEINGDRLINTIFTELNNTFITPFDREDIHALCENMDDVLDFINSSAKRIVLFQPKCLPNKVVRMAEIIRGASDCIHTAAGELKTINKKPAAALDACRTLHHLEHEGDDVYEHFVVELFENEKDSIELIKIKEIMQELERTTDRANSVGKIIKTIIVKYA